MSPPKEKRADESALKTEAVQQYSAGGNPQPYEDFRAAMSAAGIASNGQIVADGELHRFRAESDHDKNSWYILYAGPPAAGAFGCWKRSISQKWHARRSSVSQSDLQRIRQRIQDAESKGKKETATRR